MTFTFSTPLTRRGGRERTFHGLKPTAKVSRRYRGEEPDSITYRKNNTEYRSPSGFAANFDLTIVHTYDLSASV